MAASIGLTPPFATEQDDTPEDHHFAQPGHCGNPPSPLSPADSLESLPPPTPPDEYRYPNHIILGGTPATVRGRLLEYPSPPTTTSGPKYPVPLPSTNIPTTMSSNVNMNLYDFPYDTLRHDYVSGPLYIGGVLDSPRSIIQHPTFYIPSLSLNPPLNHQRLLGASIDDEGALPPFPNHELPSPTSPFTHTGLQPLEGAESEEDFTALLSPLSPEWPSHALDTLSAVGITRPSRVTGEGEPPPSHSAASPLPGLLTPPSSWKPTLPFLSIPTPSFSNLRSYEPSPSSPLWLADEFDFGSPPSVEDGSEISEKEGNPYLVSPPSSGPPDTPSPNTALLPVSLFDPSDDLDLGEVGGEFKEIFEYPSPPPPPIPVSTSPPPIPPSIPLPLASPQHELERELLRSPSVRLREFMDLPEVGASGMPSYEGSATDDWMGDDVEHGSAYPAEHPLHDDSPVASWKQIRRTKPPLELLLSKEVPAPPEPLANPDLDSEVNLRTIDPEILTRLPPQEVEEVNRISELQVRARECELVAKDLEMRLAEVSSRNSTGPAQAPFGDGVSPGRSVEEGRDERSESTHDDGVIVSAEEVSLLKTAAADARALARREKDKAREACTLVRLKLRAVEEEARLGKEIEFEPGSSDVLSSLPVPFYSQPLLAASEPLALLSVGHASTPSSDSHPLKMSPQRRHPRLAGIAQLVAKMFLNRHDSGVRRPPTILSSACPSDPLSLASDLTHGPPDHPLSSTYTSSRPSSPHSAPVLYASCEDQTAISSSQPGLNPSPYKYRHLWVKGAAAGLRHGSPSVRSPSSCLRTVDKLGQGATRQQPYAQYQRKYKFLRSSPLARYSVVASVDDEGEDQSRPLQESEGRIPRTEDASVGGLWDDEEEENGESGFEALRNPIMWDAV